VGERDSVGVEEEGRRERWEEFLGSPLINTSTKVADTLLNQRSRPSRVVLHIWKCDVLFASAWVQIFLENLRRDGRGGFVTQDA